MRLKSRTWLVISLLLFGAAFWTWRYAEKYSAAHRGTASPIVSAQSSALRLQHPALIKALETNGPVKPKSYVLRNTTQTLAQLVHNDHALILRNALIDTEVPVRLKIPAHLQAKGAPGSYLVQADRPLDKDFYSEISKAGAAYVSYVPNNAALVQASPEQATNLAANADVVAVLPYEPYYKLDSTLLPAAVEQQSETNALSVTTFPGQRDAALAALTQLGATLLGEDRSPFGPTLIVNIPAQNLVAVAQLPLAQEIEAYTPRRLMNDLTRVQLGVTTDTLTTTSNYLGLSGSNVTVNLNDTGVDSTHPDFQPPNRLQADFPTSLVDTDGHGTHVAGIIAGNGSQSYTVTFASGSVPGADFRGKATNATLYVQSLDLLFGPFISDSFLQENASQHLGTKNLISSDSWGYGGNTYDMHAASFDAATRDAQPNLQGEQPLLFVFAAGNSGNSIDDTGITGYADTINSPATAKNVITVGASDSPRFITNLVSEDDQTTNAIFLGETDNSNLVAGFSSCGNVGLGVEGTYGRFKPDVVAPGTFIVSCRAADFVDPTNQNDITESITTNQTVKPGQTNIYQDPYLNPLPSDTSEVIIQVSSNAASPRNFPPVWILADPFTPPTTVRGTNIAYLTNFTGFGPVYIGIAIPPTNQQPVEYDLNLYLIETNDLGDYFTVLSNMNTTLGAYRYETGTSMSAPAVSGLLALMQEFLEGRMGITPSPALLKALLINGSRSLGIQYDFDVTTEGPNEQGWGIPNITNSIPSSLSGSTPSMVFVDQSTNDALATGQFQNYTVNTGDSNALNFPIRVTLVWTDPPGNPAAGVALVNDLDLTVTDGTGTNIYVGNDFLSGDSFTEPSSVTNLAPSDTINNVENVYIDTTYEPIVFPLTITVNGTRVNVNAIPGQTNKIAQDYALVISSDDPALANPLTVVSNAIATTRPTLITVASNGVPLLHQRVGANEPNLYKYPLLTNGDVAQWHFFIFTNTAFSATNQATNVAFTTFLPPNLSRPRNTDADLDLYVSTDPALFLLTDKVVQKADKSVGRGGTETIIYTNSYANEVYYIGVKSEDQQGADFGFYGIAQQEPFSFQNGDGSITANGTSLPVFIPNAIANTPGLAFAFLFSPNNPAMRVRRVTVSDGIQQGNPAVLYGTLQHDGTQVVLNHNSGNLGGFTNTYDDLQEMPNLFPPDILSDGPGSLANYVNQPGEGLWLLTEYDQALTLTGYINQYSVTVDPQPPLTGFFITLQPNEWFDDFVVVPNDATNLIISALYENNGTNLAGVGPIGIYLTNFDDLNTGDYGSNNILPPGGFLSLGTNPPPHSPVPYPPLEGGLWYFGIYNQGTAPVSLFVEVLIQESLTPNLVQSFTNNANIPLLTDATTESQICVGLGQQVVDLQVGLRIADTNLDDLVIHLTSPQGTSVLLFEDRGGSNANALGLTQLTATNSSQTNQFTNFVYTVFTENTNLAFVPIKFAPPPYAFSNYVPSVTIAANGFEGLTNGVYYYNSNGTVLNGWTVSNNVITTITTNGPVYTTNDEVGIVTDTNVAEAGTNFLALTSGRITQMFATTPNDPYAILFYVRPPGLRHWWPGDDNADDIIGTNNGTLSTVTNVVGTTTNITPLVTFDDGEVNRAFTFDGVDSSVSFGTNVGNLGTNDFTFDFWIKTTASNTLSALLEKRASCSSPDTNYYGFRVKQGLILYENSISDGSTVVLYDNFNSTNSVATNGTGGFVTNYVADGFYHHVALTRQTNLLSMYIDGVANASYVSAGIANLSNNASLMAGLSACDNGDGTVPFAGDLDELDLFSRALSPAEIHAIYAAGHQGKYSTNSVLPNFQLIVDGISTNTIILTNAAGPWQVLTNSFVTTNTQVTVEFAGNTLGVLLDNIQFIQLPATNYNNYYLPEEPLTPFVGENPLGCWSLDVWDTRTDSSLPVNGTLLSWTLQLTTSSTNATLFVLTNRLPMTTNVAPNGGIVYFAVDVPDYAQFASNILTATTAGSSLNLLFDQTALPTGGLPGDVALTNDVAPPIPSTNVLATLGGLPPLQPGQRYFLGVQNNSSTTPATFTIEVDFDGMTNSIIPLTNAVAFTNVIGTNSLDPNGDPQYYSFVVPTNAVQVTFQVLNPTNGEVDLYARNGLPLPGPLTFDYQSRNDSSNDQFIVIGTNSVPVPLPTATTNEILPMAPSIWYLSVYNFAGVSNIGYTIIATVVTNSLDVIPLTNGVAYTNTAIPGYPTNTLYSYMISNNPAGVQFTVTNLSGFGNVELLVGQGVFPTPQESYSGSFNAGIVPQFVQIGTNATLPSLNGIWYLAVPNTSDSNVVYSIEATNLFGTPTTVTNAPEFLGASIASPTSGFTMYWSANPGQSYEIDVSTNLMSWSVVTNVTPQSTIGSYTDTVPVQSQKSRFFRLK